METLKQKHAELTKNLNNKSSDLIKIRNEYNIATKTHSEYFTKQKELTQKIDKLEAEYEKNYIEKERIEDEVQEPIYDKYDPILENVDKCYETGVEIPKELSDELEEIEQLLAESNKQIRELKKYMYYTLGPQIEKLKKERNEVDKFVIEYKEKCSNLKEQYLFQQNEFNDLRENALNIYEQMLK